MGNKKMSKAYYNNHRQHEDSDCPFCTSLCLWLNWCCEWAAHNQKTKRQCVWGSGAVLLACIETHMSSVLSLCSDISTNLSFLVTSSTNTLVKVTFPHSSLCSCMWYFWIAVEGMHHVCLRAWVYSQGRKLHTEDSECSILPQTDLPSTALGVTSPTP